MDQDINGVISSTNEYAIYVKLENFDIDGFLHANDLSIQMANPEEEIKKYKKGDKIKSKNNRN